MSADQYTCTEIVLETTPDAAVISNLGVSSYILIDIEDRPRNFYMNAAMGVTTPVAVGLALSTDEPVTVLDGDGSMLMSLGALATVGTYDPPNLTVVVWDNSTFETTGGQTTLAETVDFAGIARECGIAAWSASSKTEFRDAYAAAVDQEGAALVSCSVTSERPEEYPSPDYAHARHKHRFRDALSSE